jgi:hypothetical protein
VARLLPLVVILKDGTIAVGFKLFVEGLYLVGLGSERRLMTILTLLLGFNH